MDDDDDDGSAKHWQRHESRKGISKGQYALPESGVCWVWMRSQGTYTGLSVRDISANRDLCTAAFRTPITAASTSRGRRANTVLPLDDRMLLRQECESGAIHIQITGGIAVSNVQLTSVATFKDIERTVHMACPWRVDSAHRLEISSSLTPKLGERPAIGCDTARLQLQSSQSMAVVPSSSGSGSATKISEIQQSLQFISRTLEQLNQKEALVQLDQINAWLNAALRADSVIIIFVF